MNVSRPYSWMPLLATTALFSIATAGVILRSESRHSAAASVEHTVQQSQLGLKVASHKQQVDIRWDHECPAIVHADKGIMKVTEGEMSEVIPLDRRDLRDGSVSYSPMTNDVRIRLEVMEPDGATVSESARVVAIP
jgi:hypothetical protein